MSGRIADIQVVASDPRIIYMGAATGGVWKSVNRGLTWKPIFDDQTWMKWTHGLPTVPVRALIVHP